MVAGAKTQASSFRGGRALMVGSLCLAVAAVTQSWAADSDIAAEESAAAFITEPVPADQRFAEREPADQEPADQESADQEFADQEPVDQSSGPGTLAEDSRRETPAELLFGSGYLETTPEGIQLRLQVPEGVAGEITGFIGTEADDSGQVTLAFDQAHGSGVIDTRNQQGTYGRLHLRRLQMSLEDIEQGATAGSTDNSLFDDDIYKAYRQLLITLSRKGQFLERDNLLQGSTAVIFRRANGDLDITMYRRNGDDLEHLGRFLVDKDMRYDLYPPQGSSDLFAQRRALQAELQQLEKTIATLSQEVVQMMVTGEREALQPKMEQLDQLKERFRSLYQELKIPSEFEFFAITEKVNYEASHWLRMSPEAGLELATLGSSFMSMDKLLQNETALRELNERFQDMGRGVSDILNSTVRGEGRVLFDADSGLASESYVAFLARKLAEAWGAVQGDGIKPVYMADPKLTVPVLRIKGVSHGVVDSRSAVDALEQISTIVSTPGQQPDRFIVYQDQFEQMQQALGKTGWLAWLKSFYNRSSYQPEGLGGMVKETMKQKGVSSLERLVQASGFSNDVPVYVVNNNGEAHFAFTNASKDAALAVQAAEKLYGGDEAARVLRIDLGADEQQTLSYQLLTDDLRDAMEQQRLAHTVVNAKDEYEQALELRRASGMHKYYGPLVDAAFSGMTGWATGYAIQRGVDAVGDYYNHGTLPWETTTSESNERNERATFAGNVTAASAVVHSLAMPWVADSWKLFEHMSPDRLRHEGLKGSYTGVVTGAISGFTARASVAGYDYWKGRTSGTELAYELADAAARAVPVAAGSAIGHTLLPYAFNLPYVSTVLPTAYAGAVLGGMAGSVVYDNARYYAQTGYRKAVDYLYGSEAAAGSAVEQVHLKDTDTEAAGTTAETQ